MTARSSSRPARSAPSAPDPEAKPEPSPVPIDLDVADQAAASGPARPLSDEDYRALGEFRRAIRQFLAFSEDGARDHGLTAQQHQALLAIRAHPGPGPISIGELAQSLLIKNHSAVELVARLVEHDLVARRESDGDRRRIVLSLRPRGQAILEAISRRNLGRLNAGADILAGIIETARRTASRSI